jgi:DNA-binding NarL/FixJ family response regulator
MNQARRPKRPWSAEEDERLRQLAAQGLSRHAIAVQLDRDDRTVDLRAKAIQIELRVRPRAVVVGRASSTVTT